MSGLTKTIAFLIITIIFSCSQIHAQVETKRWKNEVLAEVYLMDYWLAYKYGLGEGGATIRYRGQTLRYSVKYNLHKQFAAGIEIGLFLHTNNGQSRRLYHSYIPLQVAIRYSTKNDHFGVSLVSGVPLMLTHDYQYIGKNGLWYKHVKESPPLQTDYKLKEAQRLQIGQFKLVSEIRFHYRLHGLPGGFWHIGLQHYYLKAYRYRAGEVTGPYNDRHVSSFNFIYGMSYQFQIRNKTRKL